MLRSEHVFFFIVRTHNPISVDTTIPSGTVIHHPKLYTCSSHRLESTGVTTQTHERTRVATISMNAECYRGSFSHCLQRVEKMHRSSHKLTIFTDSGFSMDASLEMHSGAGSLAV